MKRLKRLIIKMLGCASLALISCNKQLANQDISFTIQATNSFVLPGTDSNCADWVSYVTALASGPATLGTGVTAPRIYYGYVDIRWAAKFKQLYPTSIQLFFSDPAHLSSDYTCNVSSAGLNYMLFGGLGTTNSIAGPTTPPNVSDEVKITNIIGTNKVSCAISCGGIPIKPNMLNTHFTVRGHATFLALARNAADPSDGGYPIILKTPLSFEYIPLN